MTMEPRTFRAETMLAAFQEIQRELGPEAIVVSVRKSDGGAPWQVWKKPHVEVIAMKGAKGEAQPEPRTTRAAEMENEMAELVRRVTPRQEIASAGAPAGQANSSEAALRSVIAALRQGPAGGAEEPLTPVDQPPALKESPVLAKLRGRLIQQGLDEQLVRRVLRTTRESLNEQALQDADRVRGHVRRQLQAELRIQTPSATLANRIVCLVGPSGVGKTSTCAKLAAFFTRTLEKRVAWVSADTVRTGAIHEAQAYTDALGVPLHLAYTPAELAQAIQTEEQADLILIDTPGCNPRSEQRMVELGGLITAIPRRATYVVAPATAKEADLMDTLAAFGPFNLKGLIFSKMDETRAYGSLYNTAWRSQLPLAFFTNGTRVMEDLYPGQESDLVSALFGEGFAR